jgi:hypothetical protein
MAVGGSFRLFAGDRGRRYELRASGPGARSAWLPTPSPTTGVGGDRSRPDRLLRGFRVSEPIAAPSMLVYKTTSYGLPALPGAVAYPRPRHGGDTPTGAD